MKNLISTEKMLKHWLKKKVTITTATVVGFLLMGTAAFAAEPTVSQDGKKVTFEKGKTYDTGVQYDYNDYGQHSQITNVTNNGTIEITKAVNLKNNSAIRLQEEVREGKENRKELINNGDLIVKVEENKDISGVKLLGNANIVNNKKIEVTSNKNAIGIEIYLTDKYKENIPVVQNDGTIIASGENAYGIVLHNGGTIENNNNIKVIGNVTTVDTRQAVGIKVYDANSRVINKGTIEVTGKKSIGIEAQNSTEIINETGAKIVVKSESKLPGFVSANGVSLSKNSNFINKGTIEVTGKEGTAYGVFINNDNYNKEEPIFVNESTGTITAKTSSEEQGQASALWLKTKAKVEAINNGTLQVQGGSKATSTVYLDAVNGQFINNGTIEIVKGTKNAIGIRVINGTALNKGTIALGIKETKNSAIQTNTKDSNGNAKNIGIIKITDMTKDEIISTMNKDKALNLLFKGKVEHLGVIVDKNDNALFLDENTTVKEDTTTEVLNGLAQGNGAVGVSGNLTITGKGDNTVKGESFNVTGGTAAIEGTVIIDSDKINLADKGQFEVGKDSTLALKNGFLEKIDKEIVAIKVTNGGILALDNMNIKGDITGNGTATVKVDGTNNLDGNFTGLTFDFGAKTKEITKASSISEKTKVVSYEANNTLNNSKFLLGGNKEAQVVLNTKLNEKSELQNAFGNSTGVMMEGTSSVDVNNGDLLIKTGDVSGDVVIKLGDNTFTNVGVTTDSEIYKIDKVLNETADGKETVLKAEYNDKLFANTPELNNVNNAAKVVSNLFSQDTAERKAQMDKHYSSNIYSEIVKAAYDNVKMNEEAVESLTRKFEIGKWTAEGKALYSKNEYDRKGIVGDYSSEIESTGLMAAFGYGINETTTAGIAFSGVKQDVDTVTGSADADLFYLGVYGNKVVGNYDFTAGLGYQFGEYEADNNILAGTGDKYDSQTVSGYVQGRYTADLGDGLSVQPKVKLGYTYVKQDDAKDSYFGVEDAEISTFDAEAGFDVVKSVQLEKSKVDVKFGASYIRTLGDTDEEFTGRFYGAKASEGFNVLGAELAENVVKFNLGAEVINENGFFYNGGLTYEFGSNDTEAYGVNVGVGYKF